MPLIQKVGKPGSLLPWLNILSILPRPSERRRILLGLLKAISASARGFYHRPSAHTVPARALDPAGDRCRTCVSVYDVHLGLSFESKVHIFPGLIDPGFEILPYIVQAFSPYPVYRLHFVSPPRHCYGEIPYAGSLFCLVDPGALHLPSWSSPYAEPSGLGSPCHCSGHRDASALVIAPGLV
jgi:hypothetical protein